MPTIQLFFGKDKRDFQNNLDKVFEYSEKLLTLNDKTKIMIFGTRQDEHHDFNLGGHIDICTD